MLNEILAIMVEMYVVKIWGSLLAPKSQQWLDETYVSFFSAWRNKFTEDRILVHWAWNIGHGFVKQRGLSAETYLEGRKRLDEMFFALDSQIWATRLRPEELSFLSPNSSWSYIIGGDIRPDLTISSWDQQFPEIIKRTHASIGYMLTDIDGVMDEQKQIIPVITKQHIVDIHFWQVAGDVTWGMKGKISALFDQITVPCTIRILNGRDLDNVTTIMQHGTGRGTRVVIG